MASNVNTTFQIYSASSDPYKQGVNLVYLEDFSSTIALKPRGNQGFIRTLNGVVQRQNYFNEDFAAEHFGNVSGSLATMDTQGQLGEVVDHVIERRDLGQTQVRDYGSSPFTDPDQLYDNPQVVLQKYTFNELTQDVLDHLGIIVELIRISKRRGAIVSNLRLAQVSSLNDMIHYLAQLTLSIHGG